MNSIIVQINSVLLNVEIYYSGKTVILNNFIKILMVKKIK